MKIDPLNKSKKKKFLSEMSYLGDLKTNALLIKTGKEKVRAYTGGLSTEEIWDFWRVFAVEGIGVYIGKENVDKNGVKEVRLSLDGLNFFKDQIVSGVLVLDEGQEEEWFLGKDVEVGGSQVESVEDFVAVKSGESGDFIGFGKLNKDKTIVYGYLPKERRRKERG
jgi:NOL1/NOP2/fmu family ribosome biogenesis protein